jgi:hypothetical protein
LRNKFGGYKVYSIQTRETLTNRNTMLLCSLRHILPSSPTTGFSLLWRGVSLLYETQTTPGRVLNSRAVHQGQPRIKRGLFLALVDALELLSAAGWNIPVFHLKCRIRILSSMAYIFFENWFYRKG